jgi:hypothetical protein
MIQCHLLSLITDNHLGHHSTELSPTADLKLDDDSSAALIRVLRGNPTMTELGLQGMYVSVMSLIILLLCVGMIYK